MNSPARQSGMAVVSALLIAALVAVVAADMLARQARASRLLENESQRLAAIWAGRGLLEWSLQQLQEQISRDPVVRFGQAWAQPLRDVQLAGGPRFDGQIHDAQGLLNLRSLVRRDGQLDEIELATLQRLCELLDLPPALAGRIALRLQASSPTHDEEGNLVQLSKRPMPRLVNDLAGPGIDAQALQRLAPFITLLPEPSWVNGNTAPAEVLAARVPGLGLERARALVAQRDGGQWFINTGDFLNRVRLPQLRSDQVRVGITSEWFKVVGVTRIEQRQLPVQGLLFRPEQAHARIVWSQVGP